ncbi:MAG: putative porin [Acidobacteria bacterium]|nr:putative porin [Acidobacteriota bacterium]
MEKAFRTENGLTLETKDALRELVMALRAERENSVPTVAEAAAVASRANPLPSAAGQSLVANPPAQESPPWEGVLDRLKPYGDLRLEWDSNVNLDDRPDRHRQRVRFRVGTNYQLSEELLVGARLASGNPADPKSPHETMGNVLHSFNISLDRAFLTYRPAWAPGTWLTAGKFSHPFLQNPVYGELVWDADVQPEGIVGGYRFSNRGPLESLELTVGQYVLLEQSRADEGFASAFQIASRFRLSESLAANLAMGSYIYSTLTPSGARTILNDNNGNATLDIDGDNIPDKFKSGFTILNPILGFTYSGWKLPLTLSGEYIQNLRARIPQDQGWAVGAALGRAQKQGDWRFYYQWQVIQQDAVFSAFPQDDFLFQTNHRSHLFGVNNQVTDNVSLHVWALGSARDKTSPGLTTDSDQFQWRVRFQMNMRF